jgi:protein phosphatase 1 regulatory subunit 10
MPRIDPLSLLRCLSVLLGPNGGIKSKEEVIRLANLMTKFSKKLVSKCIYIQILKSTSPDLLSQFMAAGGWNLIHMWLTDGILVKNWALIQELLELLLLCPVDIERLKSNNCPKLIKGLSKEGSHQGVRTLASRLVEQWLKMVKGEAMPSVQQNVTVPNSVHPSLSQTSVTQTLPSNTNGSTIVTSQTINSENAVTVQSSDSHIHQSSPVIQPAQVQQPVAKVTSPQKSQSLTSTSDKPQITTVSPPSVYRITIRDGKQVLTQVQTDAANINSISVNSLNSEVNGVDSALPQEDDKEDSPENSDAVIERLSPENGTANEVSKITSNEIEDNGAVTSKEVDETDNIKNKEIKDKDHKDEKSSSSDSSKSSDKENRDKKDDKKSVSSSSDKKGSHSSSSSKSSSKHSSSSSKHSSSKHSSSSHRSSSKSSSSSRDKSSRDKEKDKHHSSSSSKSSSSRSKTDRDKDKEKEKEKLKKDQAEKDKATLEKVQSQSLSTKMGKIPKKKADEEKSEDSPSRKSSTDSKDSLKENKDKLDPKKIAEKKNISISIENRKNSQEQGSRPKTVKTFNSKFRSTGLEEEVKPPLRGAKKPVSSVPDKKVLPPKLPLKRPSPLRETPTVDKKAKLTLDSPTTPPSDEKKGGIKLIPAKPKCKYTSLTFLLKESISNSNFIKYFFQI